MQEEVTCGPDDENPGGQPGDMFGDIFDDFLGDHNHEEHHAIREQRAGPERINLK